MTRYLVMATASNAEFEPNPLAVLALTEEHLAELREITNWLRGSVERTLPASLRPNLECIRFYNKSVIWMERAAIPSPFLRVLEEVNYGDMDEADWLTVHSDEDEATLREHGRENIDSFLTVDEYGNFILVGDSVSGEAFTGSFSIKELVEAS